MTIVKDFPAIRAQIYREFDFSVDPKFLPEDSGQVKVSRPTSNAESVFYQEAKSNSTIQTAESVAKTAGIIAFTIAAGTVAGPFGIAAVGGTMMTTSAIVAGMDIYEAEKSYKSKCKLPFRTH